jgi:hypothetical protein
MDTPAPGWKEKAWRIVKPAVVALLAALLGAIIQYFGGDPKIVEKVVEVERDAPPVAGMGWVDSPDDVQAHLLAHRVPSFGNTPAGQAALAGDADVYLWDAAKKVTGSVLPARDQGSVGSCVSFGTASSVEHLLCVQIALNGHRAEYKDLAQEVIYGGSRVEVGGGKIRGDGSIGAWGVEWVKRWGVVPRGVHGRHDLTRYDESRCRSWGRSGVPDDLEPVARQSPVKGYALVTTFAEADKAVRQGYPVVVCSGQGFKMRRDSDGFCAPSGTWYHCMAFIGARGGNRPGLFCLNSWGPDAHTGPRFPADAPEAGFWVDSRTVDRMLGSWKDSFALSDAVGFPSRKLPDWFLANPRPARGRPLDLFARNEVKLAW